MKQAATFSPLENTLFYMMDKAIKSYRQFAHQQIRKNKFDITVDQWLVLKTVLDHPDMSQKDIARMVFKDHASVTRIIELLVRRKYLTRSFNKEDRRRFKLTLTSKGKLIHQELIPIISSNRKTALEGLTEVEIKRCWNVLEKITANCTSNNSPPI